MFGLALSRVETEDTLIPTQVACLPDADTEIVLFMQAWLEQAVMWIAQKSEDMFGKSVKSVIGNQVLEAAYRAVVLDVLRYTPYWNNWDAHAK